MRARIPHNSDFPGEQLRACLHENDVAVFLYTTRATSKLPRRTPHLLSTCVSLSPECLVTQSCPTVCDPMDCSPSDSSVHGDSPGKNAGVDCHALLQGIFPMQGSNPGVPHCRRILYDPSHQGSSVSTWKF